jgi:lysophospholipase L1-like esterase
MVSTHDVPVVAFYDEDADDNLDPGELVRIPEATVEIGTRSGVTTAPEGEAVITGVPAGSQTVVARGGSLPPYYRPGNPLTVAVPSDGVVNVPVQLPIHSNIPNRYLAFGDSITEGDETLGDFTYRFPLREFLEGFFGIAEILNSGAGGTTSREGVPRLRGELIRHKPGIVLVVYGTNDWNDCALPETCFTVDSLRSMIQETRNQGALPYVATVLPSNTGFDARAPASRNDWIAELNELIRAMVAAEGAVLMDVHRAFLDAAPDGDFSGLFEDHVHPSPEGYDLMARAMYAAITGSSAPPGFGGSGRLGLFGARH